LRRGRLGLRDEMGKPYRFVGSAIDISAQKTGTASRRNISKPNCASPRK